MIDIFIDTSVINNVSTVQCSAVCTPDSLGSITGTGQQMGQDSTLANANECCSGATSTQGYTDTGVNASPSAPCTLCKLYI